MAARGTDHRIDRGGPNGQCIECARSAAAGNLETSRRTELARHMGDVAAWTCMTLATKGEVMARTSAL